MTDHGVPGRSLFAEMTTLREEMEALRKAMGMLVDLQRELSVKVTSALERKPPIDAGLTPCVADWEDRS